VSNGQRADRWPTRRRERGSLALEFGRDARSDPVRYLLVYGGLLALLLGGLYVIGAAEEFATGWRLAARKRAGR
jgi:hypothetical protein